jgi:MFS family permease
MGSSSPKGLPRAVILLGWVSLFTDLAADMVTPLMPALLAGLGGGALALGVLEGTAEAVAALSKLVAGRLSDASGARKPFVVLGYAVAALARPLYALATLPVHVVLVRALDRVGKGLRGPPRDALLASAVAPEARGHAFGFHRMMDNLGGVAGPLVAFALLHAAGLSLRAVLVLSLVPGVVSVALALAVREPTPHDPSEPDERPALEQAEPTRAEPRERMSPALRRYLFATALFALAGSGDLLLVKRLADLGLPASLAPLAWLTLQLAKSLFNVPGGKLADRAPRRDVVALGWSLYALAYLGLGVVTSPWLGWGLFLVHAAHYGLAEGSSRALVADLAPASLRGRAFGVQLALEGGLLLVANLLFGVLYERVSPLAAFTVSAALAAVATAALVALVPRRRLG